MSAYLSYSARGGSGGGGVTSLDGLTGAITLVAGTGVTIVDGSGIITISAPNSGVTSFNSRTGAVTLISGDVTTALGYTPENAANKGVANGYASLDGGGKVPLTQLPATLLEYQGTWNANTNTPTLANGTGTSGFVYIVNVAGTTDFGAGPITFAVGDWAIYDGSIWQKSLNSNAVSSVNGATGAVTVNAINQLTGDATAGPASGSASAALTLATVNGDVGTFGTATQTSTFTVNAKGLITSASNTSIQIAESQVTGLTTDLGLKADLASPAFSGVPTAPTASQGNNSGQLATTSYVDTGLAAKQATGNYITALTGDGTAAGPGSAAFTLATVNGNVGTFNTLTVNAKGLVTAASNTSYEVPLTFSTGLTRTTNTITVNTSQNISTLSNLTTNGFVKTTGGTGALSIDTNTYLTGNQTITLTGDVTGSGATSIATTLAATTNSTLTTLSGLTTAASLATVGTITSGTWSATAIAATKGGTGLTTYTTGDTLYSSATNTLAKLAIGSEGQVQTVANGLPVWATPQFPLNYIANPGAESTTTGWATYAGTAANIPASGTGGTATNLTFSRSTSSPLYNTASFSMAQANSTSLQGKGVSYDFTINSGDQAKVLNINLGFNASSTFVASNGTTAPLNDGTTTTNAGNSDIEVFLYDITNAVLIPVTPQVITANGTNNFTFNGSFQTASNSTSYRLIFHVATTSANATGWTFKFDNVFVGRQPIVQGPPMSDWSLNAYAFTFTGLGSTSSTNVYSRRVGDSLQVQGYVTCGTSTNTPTTINFPTGLAIDTAKLTATANISQVGKGYNVPASISPAYSSTGYGPFPIFYDGSTNNFLYIANATDGSAHFVKSQNFININANFAFEFTVPITGWSTNTVMSNDADTRLVAMDSLKSAGAVTANTTIPTWSVVNQDTHGAFNSSTGLYTVPVAGDYFVSFGVATTTGNPQAQINKNGSVIINSAVSANGYGTVSKLITGLVPGDTLSVSINQSLTVSTLTSPYSTYFTVNRISGPATIAASDAVNIRYFSSSTSISGSLATIVFATKDFDTNNTYASGIFTVPSSGKYQVNVGLLITGTIALNNNMIVEIQKNSSVVSRFTEFFPATLTDGKAAMSDLISCVAGDTIRIQASSNVTGPSIVSSNFDNYLSIVRTGN